MNKPYTNERIKRLRNVALRYGCHRGLSHETAEDYAQYVLLVVVCEGRDGNLSYLLCDYMREHLGRPESYKSRGEKMTLRDSGPSSSDCFKTTPDRFRGRHAGAQPMLKIGLIGEVENRIALGNIYLPDLHRKLLYMTLGGFSRKEMSAILDVSVSRISQLITEIEQKFLGTYVNKREMKKKLCQTSK